MYGSLPKTLTLFMTKICDFPLPYLWPDQKFSTLFMAIAAGTVALNIIYERLLMMVFMIMMTVLSFPACLLQTRRSQWNRWAEPLPCSCVKMLINQLWLIVAGEMCIIPSYFCITQNKQSSSHSIYQGTNEKQLRGRLSQQQNNGQLSGKK